MNMNKNKTLYKELQNRIAWQHKGYGNVVTVATKYIGLSLDVVIPCTFGAITYILLRVYGTMLRIPIPKPTGLYIRFISLLSEAKLHALYIIGRLLPNRKVYI